MSNNPASIPIVNGDPQICRSINLRVSDCGYECESTTSSQEALTLLEMRSFDVLSADVAMPAPDGLDLLIYAQENTPECKVILITGDSNSHPLAQPTVLGAHHFLRKSFSTAELVRIVMEATGNESDTPELSSKAAAVMKSEAQIRKASLESQMN